MSKTTSPSDSETVMIIPDPATDPVEAMLESVLPRAEGPDAISGAYKPENRAIAIRSEARFAIRRLNKLTVEQIEILRTSEKHMAQLDFLVEELSKDPGVGAKRSAGRLILAREKMAQKALNDAMNANVRALEAEGDGLRGPAGGEGFTAEQAIRMLSEGRHLKVTKTQSVEVEAEGA